ncbi:hypothetical protein NOCA1170230 [metagenome]|uniref:HTH luxR-type domain-containing protein n=1 Tax=metagenome TaxID=256318 RepID=A0A2P2CBS6_9ZZZZ
MPVPGSAPLIGREASLDELRAAVSHAADGSPSVVLLTGETGAGKSRLVTELTSSEDVVVLYGACLPIAGEPLPFAPLTQALRRLGNTGVVRQQLERSPDLARLMPTWGRTPSADAVTASSRLTLFQAVLELLERAGAARPVLHVVEDLHWADRSTLDLLRYLATNLGNERVVLIVTYRADAVKPGGLLAGWIAEMARLPITARVAVERLDAVQTERMATEILGAPPSSELLQSVLARSAGNPLFVEHLVRHGAQRDLPLTLHDLLRARIDDLPDSSRRILAAAATLGRPAEVALVGQVSGQAQDQTERGLHAAIDQHVLEVRGDGAVGFAHPAFGEVVYAGLLATERNSLHRRAADALEQSVARGDIEHHEVAADLALHWLAAEDLGRALDASVAAGLAAREMFAFEEGQASFARAAELTTRVDSHYDRAWLLSEAAQAAHLAGDSDQAIQLASAALEVTEDPAGRAALYERLGAFHYLAGHGEEAEAWLRRALEGLPEDATGELSSRVHAGLAMFTAAWSRMEEAEHWAVAGLAVARQCGAVREEGLLLNACGSVLGHRGEHDEAIAHLRRALTIAAEVGGPDDLALAYVNLSHVLGLAGRLDQVADTSRAGSEELGRIGLTSQIGSVLTANACEALIDTGRLDEAASLLTQALARRPRGIMAAPLHLQAGRLATLAGDLDVAWEHCEQARLVMEAENAPDAWRRTGTECAADVELWAGRPEAAHRLVTDELELIAGTDEDLFAARLVVLGRRAVADFAERHRDKDSRRQLAEMQGPLDEARSRAPRGTTAYDDALAAWEQAELSRLASPRDAQPWAGLGGLWDRAGRRPDAAYARWREAEARLGNGSDGTAIATLRDAHRRASGLGSQRLLAEIGSLARWHRIDLAEDVEVVSDPDQLAAYEITSRELEVLGCLVAGLTNGEIADRLFISAKTASVHVSNILRKLDVSGRQEAARVGHRLGVAAAEPR